MLFRGDVAVSHDFEMPQSVRYKEGNGGMVDAISESCRIAWDQRSSKQGPSYTSFKPVLLHCLGHVQGETAEDFSQRCLAHKNLTDADVSVLWNEIGDNTGKSRENTIFR